jgi:hypothetical protein
MAGASGRYFIELQPKSGEPIPRFREAEIRREQAADFIAQMSEWLRREALEGKVSSMAITALGQVQIICEADVINHLCEDEETHIAAVRHGAMFIESMTRWNESRTDSH